MNKQRLVFAARTLIALASVLVVGCTTSQEQVLGSPPMTTEQVMEEVINGGGDATKWRQSHTLLTRDSVEQYHNKGWAASGWDSQTSYLSNERLILFFYPKRDRVGGIRPGYVTEIPLYQQVHISWDEE
ncbi:hypothetical protein AB9X29_003735 [Vibrio vulnificus]